MTHSRVRHQNGNCSEDKMRKVPLPNAIKQRGETRPTCTFLLFVVTDKLPSLPMELSVLLRAVWTCQTICVCVCRCVHSRIWFCLEASTNMLSWERKYWFCARVYFSSVSWVLNSETFKAVWSCLFQRQTAGTSTSILSILTGSSPSGSQTGI